MTDTAGKELTPEVRVWIETWKSCLEQVLSQVSGHSTVFELSPEPVAAADTDLWYTAVIGGAVRGEMNLRLPSDSGNRLAQKFLGEAELAPELTAEHKEALEELLRQVAGQAATALARLAGGEVQIHIDASGAASWASSATACLLTRDEAGTPVTVEIQISAALASALLPPAESAVPIASPGRPMPPAAASYERLKGVNLEVKIRFGHRRMILRDVLGLSAGVVVELDSNVNSPVDLLLDGRVVAQGEVVVVDGRYGLRVTHLQDPPSPA